VARKDHRSLSSTALEQRLEPFLGDSSRRSISSSPTENVVLPLVLLRVCNGLRSSECLSLGGFLLGLGGGGEDGVEQTNDCEQGSRESRRKKRGKREEHEKRARKKETSRMGQIEHSDCLIISGQEQNNKTSSYLPNSPPF
jgi:hypothetical protein